jgi:hypothetical protein
MATVADLYAQVLGRAPDAAGLAYWESMFGPTVDPTEAATFKSVAAVTEPTAAVAPAVVDTSPTPSTSAAATTTVEDLYKKFYGTVDPTGAAYWKQQFGSSVDPLEQAKFIKEVANHDPNVNTGVTVDQAFKTYLGGNTDQAGIDYWKSQLGTGQLNAGQLAQLTNRQYGLMDEGGGLFGGGGVLGTGLSTSDLAKAAALYYGGTALADYLGSGALTAGGEGEALSGLDLGGVGASPNTWLGEGVYGTVPAAAGATGALATSGTAATGAVPAEAAVTGAGTGVGTGAGTGILTNGLTGTDLTTLAKAGITAAGLLGGTKAISGLTGGGTGGGVTLPVQNRAGVSSGSAQYSPEYYKAIQAKYNQMMPQQPRDVTTELKNWYETKFTPKVTQ